MTQIKSSGIRVIRVIRVHCRLHGHSGVNRGPLGAAGGVPGRVGVLPPPVWGPRLNELPCGEERGRGAGCPARRRDAHPTRTRPGSGSAVSEPAKRNTRR